METVTQTTGRMKSRESKPSKKPKRTPEEEKRRIKMPETKQEPICTIVRQVDFKEVLTLLDEQYTTEEKERCEWTRNQVIIPANGQSVSWVIAQIPIAKVGDIVLPWNRQGMIPCEGQTLSEVNRRFHNDPQYRASDFYKRIMKLAGKPLGHIFLSDAPVAGYSSHKDLKSWDGHLIVLDGLHRLLALMQSDEQPEQIEVIIALSSST
jgi:hypothetical protein